MKIALFANTDWYIYNFRLALAARLVEEGHDVILLSPDGPYGRKLLELGLDWRPVAMNRRSLELLTELGLVWYLYRLLTQEHVDVVHGFTIKPAVYGALAGRLSGARGRVGAIAGMGYVFTSEDLRARFLRPLVRAVMKVAFSGRSARLVLQNPDDMQVFVDHGLIQESSIRLIPGSGVDCVRFAPVQGRSCKAPNLRVLFAARLLWDKGIGEYVAAAQAVREKYPDCEFLVAGEPDTGNPAAVPKSKMSRWKLLDGLTWLGHVDDMPGLYQDVDIVVLPSYREGMPKSLLEAAACALPIVTTDVPGCREVVDHLETGVLVPSRNAAALANAIEQLINSAELRSRLGNAARRKVVAKFEQDKIVRETIALYSEFLE